MFAITVDGDDKVIGFTVVTRREFDELFASDPTKRFVDRSEFKTPTALVTFIQQYHIHYFDENGVLRRQISKK